MPLVFCFLTMVHNDHLPVTVITGSKTESKALRDSEGLGH